MLRKSLLFTVVMAMCPGGLVSCQSKSARDLDRVTESLASREILRNHLGKGSREIDIQILASVPDLSLYERLALGWTRSLMAQAVMKNILESENQKFLTASLSVELMSNRATLNVADYWATAVRSAAMGAEADRAIDAQKTLNELEMGFNNSLTPAKAAEIIQLISRLKSATTPELEESRTALKSAVRAALTANPETLSSLVQATARLDTSISADLRDSRKRLLALIRPSR